MEADECFHALSYADGPGGQGKRFLDKDHMTQAVEDLLQKWDISLEEDGEAAFKKNHFEMKNPVKGYGSNIKSEDTIRGKLKILLTRIEAVKFSLNPHHKFDFDWQHERFMEYQQIFDLKLSPKPTPEKNENDNKTDVQMVRIGFFVKIASC